MEFPNDFDEPNQMGIELRKLLRGHPQFLMDPTADHLDGVSLSELGVDVEPGHIPGPTVLDVPVLGNVERPPPAAPRQERVSNISNSGGGSPLALPRAWLRFGRPCRFVAWPYSCASCEDTFQGTPDPLVTCETPNGRQSAVLVGKAIIKDRLTRQRRVRSLSNSQGLSQSDLNWRSVTLVRPPLKPYDHSLPFRY